MPPRPIQQLLDQGHAQLALKACEAALASNPTSPDLWSDYGRARWLLGDIEEADRGFRQALEIDPDHAEAQRNLDRLHRDLREKNGAAELEREANELLRQGEAERARLALQQAVRAEPTAERYNSLAGAYLLLGEKTEAEAGFRRALELDPQHVTAAANLGVLLMQQERTAEAAPWLQRAWARSSDSEREQLRPWLEACAASTAPEPAPAATPTSLSLAPVLEQQTLAIARVVERMTALEDNLRELLQRVPKPTALNDEQAASRTIVQQVPAGELLSKTLRSDITAPLDPWSPLPLSERLILSGLLAGLFSHVQRVLHWGPLNTTTLDLASSLPQAQVYHVAMAGAVNPFDHPQARQERAALAPRVHALPLQAADFNVADWAGSFDLGLINGDGTYEQVLEFTRTAQALLRPEAPILWDAYGVSKGVTWAVNHLFLTESRRFSHIAGTSLVICLPLSRG